MAQAFEIPLGNRIATSKMPQPSQLRQDHPRVPRHTFQIAAPDRPDPISRIDNTNMGPVSVRRKRANAGSDATAPGQIPGPAISRRLINAVGFDKAV
jgi:hypothetical protein